MEPIEDSDDELAKALQASSGYPNLDAGMIATLRRRLPTLDDAEFRRRLDLAAIEARDSKVKPTALTRWLATAMGRMQPPHPCTPRPSTAADPVQAGNVATAPETKPAPVSEEDIRRAREAVDAIMPKWLTKSN
jgi:hypothetical protein